MRRETIFGHIMRINLLTVILGTVFLSLFQYFLLSNYVSYTSEEKLKEDAREIVKVVNREGSISSDGVRSYLEGFAQSSDYSVFVVDKEGRIALEIATGEEFNSDKTHIDKSYLRNKEYALKGTLDGTFSEEMNIYVMPILEEDKNGVRYILGSIIISGQSSADRLLSERIPRIAVTSALIALILAFMFTYYSSGKIVRPIRKIKEGAGKFAKGEFSERVELSGSDGKIKELNELAESFNNMATELEHFEEIRNNFISDVSHELRTPMTTITGFVEGILDGTIPKEREEEYLKIVYDECRRLSALVHSFLETTRSANRKIELEMKNFDINRLIETVLMGFEKRIDEKNIKVSVVFSEEECVVLADRDAMRRVITNLLDNAVKFTQTGKNIVITVSDEDKDIGVSIKNFGKEIPLEEQSLIFERFYKQDKSRSENKEGTGIGLYIVKNIINRHGKTISVKSENGFTEFKFSLPKGKF